MPSFTNQATLSYQGGTINSNIAVGQIVEVLSAAKSSLLGIYRKDDMVTYVVSIVNTGSVAFTDLTVSDNLGAYVYQPSQGQESITLYPLTYRAGSLKYYQNGTLTASPTVTQTNGLTITGVTVPAGGNAILIYEARTNEFAPLEEEGKILNRVQITGETLNNPITVENTIEVQGEPQLAIFKSLSPLVVAENGQVTYTFTIQNLGNEEAGEDYEVRVIDTFRPILSDLTVTYNGDAVDPANYSYSSVTGLFTTNLGLITVPAATYTRDPQTGAVVTTPGEVVITVTGRIG